MLKVKSQLIVGAFLASRVLSNCYGSLVDPAANPATGEDDFAGILAEARKQKNLLNQRLCDAVIRRDFLGITKFVAGGADVTATHQYNRTVLHYALCSSVIRQLLELGLSALINQQDDFGWTVAHFIVWRMIRLGFDEIARMQDFREGIDILIEYKINLLASNNKGQTACAMLKAAYSERVNRGDLSPEVQAFWEGVIWGLEEAERACAEREAQGAFQASLAQRQTGFAALPWRGDQEAFQRLAQRVAGFAALPPWREDREALQVRLAQRAARLAALPRQGDYREIQARLARRQAEFAALQEKADKEMSDLISAFREIKLD
jgi:hypothetical protein